MKDHNKYLYYIFLSQHPIHYLKDLESFARYNFSSFGFSTAFVMEQSGYKIFRSKSFVCDVWAKIKYIKKYIITEIA